MLELFVDFGSLPRKGVIGPGRTGSEWMAGLQTLPSVRSNKTFNIILSILLNIMNTI